MFTTISIFDIGDIDTAYDDLNALFFLVYIISIVVLVAMAVLIFIELWTGRRQAVLHPGLQFDPREYFDKIPTIIYEPFSNLKFKDWAIWLMDYQAEDIIKVMPVCFHTFHSEWIKIWLSNNSTWPFCRNEFTRNDIERCKNMSEEELYRHIQTSIARPSMFSSPNHHQIYNQRSSREFPYNPNLA